MLEYLSPSQISSELNLRGYFAETTPPASTPPATTSVTGTQVLGWIVDLALQNIGKPFTPAQTTYLTSAEWNEVLRVALIAGPQVMQQYGVSFDLTPNLIEWNLHTRNYWLASTPVTPPVITPPVSLPSITLKAYTAMVVDKALTYYGRPLKPSTTTYISTGQWSNIINYASNYDNAIDQDYSIMSGINGMSGFGSLAADPCAGKTGFALDSCLLANTTPGTTWVGWEILLSMLSVGAGTWADAMERKRRLSEEGYSFDTPVTSTDYNARAQQLIAQFGWNRDQAYQYIDSYNKPQTDWTKYLLPLGIGIGAYLLISRRS